MIKRLGLIACVLCLLVSLAACGRGQNSSDAPVTSIAAGDAAFQKPAGYAAVLRAAINPQIQLYLDKDGSVLAIEAVNADARQLLGDLPTGKTDCATVIREFIQAANSRGFIREGARITLEIAEMPTSIYAEALLTQASQSARDTAGTLNLSLEVVTGDIPDNTPASAPEQSEPAPGTPTTAPNANTSTAGTTRPSPAHTHSYAAATCTKAATCTCGATQGAALGHSWQPATCQAPKTCKTCGATEGAKGNHTYKNGQCTICGAADRLNPQTALERSVEYLGGFAVQGNDLVGWAFQIDAGDDTVCILSERYFSSTAEAAGTPVVYKGVTYYSMGGAPNPYYCTITSTEILVQGSLYEEKSTAVTLRLTLQSDGMLRVTQSANPAIPVGLLLSRNIQDVLK